MNAMADFRGRHIFTTAFSIGGIICIGDDI